ncbi:hypothetical protein [Maioricimonas sp. JC845]|uniref:hypothetical protein n=1 Tax=Maioricimonas sp. JC845 TaxID=3232138 RepID=UPI003458A925
MLRSTRMLALGLLLLVATGCDQVAEFGQMSETTERDLSHQAEQAVNPQEAAPAMAESIPVPLPSPAEPEEPLPPAEPPELPLPAAGGVVEVEVDGVVFRLTECYRLPVGIACTGVAWNTNSENSVFGIGDETEISLNTGDAALVRDWVYGRTRHANIDAEAGHYELQPNEMVQWQAIWRGVDPFSESAVVISIETHLSKPVEFRDIPVTDPVPGTYNGRSREDALAALREYLVNRRHRQLYWRFNQYSDWVGFRILKFDEETGRIEGKILPQKLLPRTKGKPFVGQLVGLDGEGDVVLRIATVREEGEPTHPTREITNRNLLSVGQTTMFELQPYHAELIGRNVDGVTCVLFLW